MGNKEIKTTALPNLDNGDIWATRNQGVFVVVSSRPAQWRGEDRDVYGHINTWYTVREATETESALWAQAVVAANQRRELRKSLNAESLVYNVESKSLMPTTTATRMLDSYDDRWVAPKSVSLTPEQIAIEEQYITIRQTLKGHN